MCIPGKIAAIYYLLFYFWFNRKIFNIMLITPLEQFQILSLFSIKLFYFDFSITNLMLSNIILLIFYISSIYLLSSKNNELTKKSFFVFPNVWQVIIELLYETVMNLLMNSINIEGEKYFPFVSMLFLFILFSNLIGLIPYNFTITSHIIITFSFSLSVFAGVTLIGIWKHEIEMLALFIPANTTFALALLLVPIEFFSYVFKPVSLGVRLFANLMAGHTLLKVIVGFSWSMLLAENLLIFIHIIPLLILTIFMGLELGVALIQAYVFTLLTCIYLNDSINLH